MTTVWFRNDLRITDNTALSAAINHAIATGTRLYGLFLVSPYEWVTVNKWGLPKCDYYIRSAHALQTALAKLDIDFTVQLVKSSLDLSLEESEFDIPEEKCETALGEIASQVLLAMQSQSSQHCFFNRSYDAISVALERSVKTKLTESGYTLHAFDDECIVPVSRIRTQAGTIPKVYTPFKKQWASFIEVNGIGFLDTLTELSMLKKSSKKVDSNESVYSLVESSKVLQFLTSNEEFDHFKLEEFRTNFPAGEEYAKECLDAFFTGMIKNKKSANYSTLRNQYSIGGSSRLSAPLAVGAISLRMCLKRALLAETDWTGKTSSLQTVLNGDSGIGQWISELAWRDFYRHILDAYPHISHGKAFKEEFENLPWNAWPVNSHGESDFKAWCNGVTGYPIVDAAMRQLKTEGWMDNRTRMIVSMFLTKHLLVHWRRGERFFQRHLVDYDFSSNNGGWQWSASTGTDSQPYFRVFNPLLQSEKYTKDGKYLKLYIDELRSLPSPAIHDPFGRVKGHQLSKLSYPNPIVEHKEARERALAFFSNAKKRNLQDDS